MITKRDLVIAVLCTFCLTFTLFTILPAGSNYTTSSVGEYAPWLDFNDDGRVDLIDVYVTHLAYGTTGDPTKNVNVTNWPEDRPTIVMKKTQRIPIMESTTGGVYIPYGNWYLGSTFVFNFEPVGQLINVTEFYVSAIWKCPDNSAYILQYTVNWPYNYSDVVDNSANPRAWYNRFVLSGGWEIHEGVNELNIWRPAGASTGNVILYKFELLVVYFSAV